MHTARWCRCEQKSGEQALSDTDACVAPLSSAQLWAIVC